ncbi:MULTISPECIES: restriction endonuclease subunit S [Methylomicrobium]|uniref:Restriction endonuclease S subunit n=1 Tax=Methylomicrobium album BG8 TaxID=686340 RepID=H8GNP1_METAL|nr:MULTISPECIES: restriction endonuclease subunit S [Methylomicrobium]EIC30797.1 restriction endonuclease S subunit [Methylomicrobium album BG8]
MTSKNRVAEANVKYLADEVRQAVPVGGLYPPGYKQTEVGVIPEDWDCCAIGDFNPFVTSGSRGWASFYASHGNIFVRITNMSRESIYLDLIETKFVLLPHQSSEGKRTSLENGDILISITADIGICSYVDVRLEKPAFINQHVALVRFDKNEIDSKYVAYFLSSENVQKLFKGAADQGAKAGMNLDAVRKIKTAIPSKLEQTAIANVLSNVDALIHSLEKLIAKKQAIKTAAMQQLLTGRTRLPQFALREDGTRKGYMQSELGEIPEDWDCIHFGNLFEDTLTRKILKASDTVSFVGMQDVTENAQLSNTSLIKFSDIKSGFTYFEKGDVLVAKITPCFENGKGCHTDSLPTEVGYGSTEFHVFRAKENSDARFIYFWTTRNNFRITLESEMVGSAGHRRVPFSAIQKYLIPSPKNKEEQTAIATILSDMEAEIQTLQKRLAKTRQTKQGMMQELLTGRIRLI